MFAPSRYVWLQHHRQPAFTSRQQHMSGFSAERPETESLVESRQETTRSELILRIGKDIDIGFNSPSTGRNCRLYNLPSFNVFAMAYSSRIAIQQSRPASTAPAHYAWLSRYQLAASSIPFGTFPSRRTLPHISFGQTSQQKWSTLVPVSAHWLCLRA